MSARDNDKMGREEFPGDSYQNKIVAREAKEIKARAERDRDGKPAYPRTINKPHREDRRDRK